jgi:hypothetical protein
MPIYCLLLITELKINPYGNCNAFISVEICGVIATFIKSYLDMKNSIDLNHREITKENYRGLLIFMACALDIEKRRYFSLNEQVPIKHPRII